MNERNLTDTQGTNDGREPMTAYQSPLLASYEKEMAAYRPQPSPGVGQDKRRNGTSFSAYLASFLVGAMLVGGFGYAADRGNLFGGQGSSAGASGSASEPAAGITTASVKAKGDIATVFETASPAVVKIENYAVPTYSMRSPFGGRGGGGQQRQASEPVLAGSGTGFFFSTDGYILTNEHVIADADELKVTVEGYDEPLTAKLVGSNYELDLAVLKVESPDGQAFPALELGNVDQTSIGDWVIAIGNPYGLDHTMTLGVLSAKGREITITDEQGDHTYRNLLQTDASINSGNSGGPLLNERGEVVGMNTAVNSEAQGIGFAIPSSTIQEALNDLMNVKPVVS